MTQLHSTNCPCQRVVQGAFGQRALHPGSKLRVQQQLQRAARSQRRAQSVHSSVTRCTAAQPGLDAGASTPSQQAQNVEPISSEGRDTYRPQSFKEIVEDAVTAVLKATERGHNRLEVEFPPIPATQSKQLCYNMILSGPWCSSVSETLKGSCETWRNLLLFGLPNSMCCSPGSSRTSDDFIDANVQLGLSAAGMVGGSSSNPCRCR